MDGSASTKGATMLDEKRITYQAKTRVLRYRVESRGRGALTDGEEKALRQLMRDRAWVGQPVDHVLVDFEDEGAWMYHRDALAYLGLQSSRGGEPYGAPAFGDRVDIGMKEGKGQPGD